MFSVEKKDSGAYNSILQIPERISHRRWIRNPYLLFHIVPYIMHKTHKYGYLISMGIT